MNTFMVWPNGREKQYGIIDLLIRF